MASPRSGPLRAFRIANGRYPILDGSGAMRYGARWNSPGRRVIYASEIYSGALLEILVHTSGGMPAEQVFVEIEIPAGVSVESVAPGEIPGWDTPSFESARKFGDRWYDERRSAVLLVPSVVTRVERNVMLNQDHPELPRIRAGQPLPVRWDSRLWEK
jgi:RES domain-containing protein